MHSHRWKINENFLCFCQFENCGKHAIFSSFNISFKIYDDMNEFESHEENDEWWREIFKFPQGSTDRKHFSSLINYYSTWKFIFIHIWFCYFDSWCSLESRTTFFHSSSPNNTMTNINLIELTFIDKQFEKKKWKTFFACFSFGWKANTLHLLSTFKLIIYCWDKYTHTNNH